MFPNTCVRCPVCGGDGFSLICAGADLQAQAEELTHFHRRRLKPGAPQGAEQERNRFTQDYTTNLVECAACGLLLRNPRPDPEQTERAYQRDRYGEERLQQLFDSQLPQQRRFAAWISRRIPECGGPIIEVGSFVGAFLAACGERGWSASGIDPGSEAEAFCKRKGLRVLPTTLPEAQLPGRSAICVAIWNTFDQLPDPGPTLRAAREVLQPGGLLAIRVPNGACFRAVAGCLWVGGGSRRRAMTCGTISSEQPQGVRAGLARPLVAFLAWNNLLAFPYLNGYTAASLDRLIRSYGFRRIAIRPDVLCALADENTALWAALEERLAKALGRAISGAAGAAGQFTPAPWLNLMYRVE